MKRREAAAAAGGRCARYPPSTHVAPTVHSLRNAGVNWYRTKRPALASASKPSSSLSTGPKRRRAKLLSAKTTSTCLPRSKFNSTVTAVGRLGDLKQNRSSLQVSDFEACEVHVVDVVLGVAEVI